MGAVLFFVCSQHQQTVSPGLQGKETEIPGFHELPALSRVDLEGPDPLAGDAAGLKILSNIIKKRMIFVQFGVPDFHQRAADRG